MTPAPHRRRTVLTVVLLVLGVVLAGGGVALAVHGSVAGRAGPASVVRRYFAALQRGDASAALGLGTVPTGSRTLVSDAALRAQQRYAPLSGLVVLDTRTAGGHATVRVGYQLGHAGGDTTVAATVHLHHADAGWLLDAAAVPTRFAFTAAGQRATIDGLRVPGSRALVFPGAVALRFDSPYLRGTLGNDDLSFGAPATTRVDVAVTPAGRRAAAARVRSALAGCLAGRVRPATTCPQPDERYLPGSLRGVLTGPLRGVRVTLTGSPVGLLGVRASATAQASYRRLDFTDQLRTGRGRVDLAVHAVTVAAHAGSGPSVWWTR